MRFCAGMRSCAYGAGSMVWRKLRKTSSVGIACLRAALSEQSAPAVIDAAFCATLIALAWFVFRKIVRLWWMFDDPFLLNILKTRGVAHIFNDSDIYRFLGTPLFNPFLLLSLRLDLTVFGLDAWSFYVHYLVSFILITPMLYLLLRLWCSPLAAGVAAAVFTVAGPTLDV